MMDRIFPDDTDRLMSLDEVAARLKTSNVIVAGLVKTGLLTAIRIGPYKRVRKLTFNEFLRQNDGKDLKEILEGAEKRAKE